MEVGSKKGCSLKRNGKLIRSKDNTCEEFLMDMGIEFGNFESDS
jgi:hypothetical protein